MISALPFANATTRENLGVWLAITLMDSTLLICSTAVGWLEQPVTTSNEMAQITTATDLYLTRQGCHTFVDESACVVG